jgi:DNA-binding CsgD family transcriptional regulator
MQYTYGAIFLVSLVLLPLYFSLMRKKQNEPWLLVLFVSVATVNLGYTMIAFAKSVEFALFANKVAYLGQVMMPLCMFMIISKLCGYQYKKWFTAALIGAAVLMLAIVCTTGYLDWYYTDATIEKVAGATVLRKEYGILHPTNLIYVIGYFMAMIGVLCVSLFKHKGAQQKQACIMLAVVVGNIGLWCIQKVIPWEFELLSAIYPISAFAFLCLWLMLQDYVHKRDIPVYTPRKKEELAVQITAMTMDEKLAKVLTFVKADSPLSIREREILEMIIAGTKRKEIADTIHLSENTVKTYTRTLYGKLGISCREELYELLLQNNASNAN